MSEVNLKRRVGVLKSIEDVLIENHIDPNNIEWPSLDRNLQLQEALKKLKGYSREDIYYFVEKGIDQMQTSITKTFDDLNNSPSDGSEDEATRNYFRENDVPASLAKKTLVKTMAWFNQNVFDQVPTRTNPNLNF